MRLRLLLLPALSGFLCLPATGADWIPLRKGAPPGAPSSVRVLSCSTKSILVEVTVPGFWAEKTAFGRRIRLPGGLPTMDEGRPELSFLDCALALPAPAEPRIELRSVTWVLPRALKVRMAPRAELEGRHFDPPPPSAPGEAYPPAQAETAYTGLWRTMPLAILRLHPFKTRGDGTLLGVAARMIVEVVPAHAPAAWPPLAIPEEFLPLAESMAANFSFLPSTTTPPLEPTASGTEYLVISPPALASGVTSLVDWRKRQGYRTEVVTTTSANPAVIKGLIQARYAGGNLKYVVLVGDYAQIPWYVWSNVRSDMWYACLTGGSTPDLIPDVGLGRLSGTTPALIAHQAAKILKYEKNPPPGNWYTRTLLAAHRQGAPGKYVGCSEQIARGALASGGWTILKQYGNRTSVSNKTVSDSINAGVGLVNYRGRGGIPWEWPNGWNTHSGGYSVSLVTALHNGDMTPMVFNIGCSLGKFQVSCLQEAWLQANDAAVASLAPTQASYTAPNDEFDKELYRVIFQYKLTDIYHFWYKGVVKLLSMGTYGKMNAMMYWWAGDGRTSLWSRAPSKLSVIRPSYTYVGARTVSVTVKDGSSPVRFARVCLYKGSEVFAVGFTGSTGQVDLQVTPTTPGSMLLTVTARDRRPFLGSIQVFNPPPWVHSLFLSALNIKSGTHYKGQIWETVGDSLASRRVTLPSLFDTKGIEALIVTSTSSSSGAIGGYLSTIEANKNAGHVYSFTIKNHAMTSWKKLDTTPFAGGNLAQLHLFKGRIYTVHRDSAGKGAIISSVPTGGGPARLETDLAKNTGFQGIGNAMAGMGADLFVATTNPAPGGREQIWRWNATTGKAVKLGVVPKTLSTRSCFNPVNMQISADGHLVLIGGFGDLAWIRPGDGRLYKHRHTGHWIDSLKRYSINPLESGCQCDRQTFDWWLGTNDGSLDVLSGAHGADQVKQLDPSASGRVTAVAFIPGAAGDAHCFGDGGRGTGGYFPVEVYMGAPHVHMKWRIGLYGAPGGTAAILGFGASRTQWGPLPLPFDLGPFGAAGNRLRSSFDVTLGFLTQGRGAGKGRVKVPVGIPDDPNLVGSSFFTQWIVLDNGANTLGITVSNAYEAKILP